MNTERILRAVRSHPALWGDLGPKKEQQASRLISRCKARLEPMWKERVERLRYERGQRFLYLTD